MTKVSMDLVKQLREQTQVGLTDCKHALEESGGDIEKAVEILRKKGTAVAAKRAGNETTKGRIEGFVSVDSKIGAMVEIGCETDFSANTDAMKTFAMSLAEHVAFEAPIDVDVLKTQKMSKNGNLTAQQAIEDITSKICEKIQINKFIRYAATPSGLVYVYIHPGSTIGTMVEVEFGKNVDAAGLESAKVMAKDLCMQIAVTNPLYVDPSQIDQTVLEKERSIAREQLKGTNKPENIIEKIVEGKLSKFYEEVCLVFQPFIKNDKQKVKDYIEEVAKKLGTTCKVVQFKRFSIGR